MNVRMTTSAGRSALTVLLACWFHGAPASKSPEFIYEPAAITEANRGTAQQAAGAWRALGVVSPELVVAAYPYPYLFSTSRPGVTLKWGARALHIDYEGEMDAAAPRRIDYTAVERIGVVKDWGHRGVPLGGDWYLWCHMVDSDRKNACARAFADMLAFARFRAAYVRASDERFQKTLEQYADAAKRPPFPEEARRFKVQAESAVAEKRLGDAVARYVDAVHAAPWWGEGYFNLALLNAELAVIDGDGTHYEEAVRMMKRFLALEPQHPQARAAQDQLYIWEDKVRAGLGDNP